MGETGDDGILQRLPGRVAPLGEFVPLDHAEDRFDVVQLRTVGWQVEEVDALLSQHRQRHLDDPTAVHAADAENDERDMLIPRLVRLDTLGYMSLTRCLATFARLRPTLQPPAFTREQMHPAPVTGAVQDAEVPQAEAIGKLVALLSGNTLFLRTRLVAGEGVPDGRGFPAAE